MEQGVPRRDLDKTLIRMGGRDYHATNLIGAVVLFLIGVGLVIGAAVAKLPALLFWAGCSFCSASSKLAADPAPGPSVVDGVLCSSLRQYF
jgi:hypothetical protein